jgi:hypothetical protein
MRTTGGGYSVCECSVCLLSCTSLTVMSHCDIHHESVWRDPIIFSVWQDDIILDLYVTPFITNSRSCEIIRGNGNVKKVGEIVRGTGFVRCVRRCLLCAG